MSADRRPWFADFDDAHARGSRMAAAPCCATLTVGATDPTCGCRSTGTAPEAPAQLVAPTLKSIVGGAISLIDAITTRRAER
ncbi:hypothetical protein ABZ412_34315 [Nocardia sp. NPDC005746]|uniref:hypothetical protein n=1 Tax=Nocardia sp. NPDC005746 TaxID=3157062 RepID=UPI00340303D9